MFTEKNIIIKILRTSFTCNIYLTFEIKQTPIAWFQIYVETYRAVSSEILSSC